MFSVILRFTASDYPFGIVKLFQKLYLKGRIKRINKQYSIQGRIQDFKLRGAHFKTLRRAEGGAKIFGLFRVKNHDFTPKNPIFFQF